MKRSPEILDRGTKYTVPDAFNKPRSHFYATNSMLNYQYGGPLMNSVKHIFGEGGFKPMAKNIPSPYKFAGTKIYRDTTEIPNFRQGGTIEKPWLNNLYPNGGQLYTYADRPEAVYTKDNNGNWLIKLPSTNGQFVALNDPTGKRAGELNEKAVLMPSQFRRQYDALNDIQPQVAVNTAVNNTPKADASIIDKTIANNQAIHSAAIQQIQTDPNLTSDQRAAILSDPEQIKGYEIAVTRPDAVQAYTPTQQSFGDRLVDIAYNPFTAAGYFMRGQEIPDNLQRRLDYGLEDRNALDFVTDVSPIGAVHSADNIITKATDDIDNNFWTKNTALDALNILPTAKFIRAGMKGFRPLPSTAAVSRIPINPNIAVDLGTQSYPQKAMVGLVDEAGRVPEGMPTSQNNIKSSVGNLKSFAKELVGSAVNRNRAQSLREAEDWMTNWMQHPATQQKIQEGYKFGLNYPKDPTKFSNIGMSNIPYSQRIISSPIATHNLGEGIKFSSGYNATGRLGEYPLGRQAAELLQLNTPGVHADNVGVSFTHNTQPGNWINTENVFNNNVAPSLATPVNHPRHGNWVSRTLTPNQRVSTGIHELTHDAVRAETLAQTGQGQILTEGIDPDALMNLRLKHADDPKVLEGIEYYSYPTEVHARVMEARKHFGLTPDMTITPQKADDMMTIISKGKTPIEANWAKLFPDSKRAATMFNKAWMAPAAVAGGTAATLLNNPWASKEQPMGLRNGGKFQTSYYSSDVRDNYYANGGMIKRADGSYSRRGLWDNIRANAGSGKEPTKEMLAQERKINREYAKGGSMGLFKKKNNNTGLLATDIMSSNSVNTPLLPGNEAFPLPLNSSVNTQPIFNINPNPSTAPVDCVDGRCYETDQIQEMYDKADRLPVNVANFEQGIADKLWTNPKTGERRNYIALGQPGQDAREIWREHGINNFIDPSCMYVAGLGWRCAPETKNYLQNFDPVYFNSNSRFINAVDKGIVPFTRTETYSDPSFDKPEKGNLQVGDIVNFKGADNSHAMTFMGYDENGKSKWFDSNGSAAMVNVHDAWDFLMPNNTGEGRDYAYVNRFDTQRYVNDTYGKQIQELEEKARINPTYVQEAANAETTIGTLPMRPLVPLTIQGDRTFQSGGSLPKPYSLPEDSFRQGGNNLHNSIYASTPGQYPQPYREGGSLVTNSSMPTAEPVRSNIIPASAFEAPVQFYPEVYTDIEKSDGTSYKQSIDGKWYISGPRAKDFTLMHDPAGIWADSLQEGIRQAKVVPTSQIPIQDNSRKV